MYDIIIIGAGPAGLTAALYAKRALKKVLVLDSLSYGGQIINTLEIDNYPVTPHISGFDFATGLYNQVKDLKCDIKFEEVIQLHDLKDKKEVLTSKNTYYGKTVIIAAGSKNRKLGVDHEEELIGHGISYCATCDGAFFKGKDVAVVGGGNTAIEDALYLSDICHKVYLIYRKDESNLKAEKTTINKLKNKDNVTFIFNTNVTALNGKDKLQSIEITNNNSHKEIINLDGVFVAIGRIPETQIFKNLIETSNDGYIVSNELCHTNVSGIFVAGDIRVKNLRQLVTATSDGAIAATEAIKYLNNLE